MLRDGMSNASPRIFFCIAIFLYSICDARDSRALQTTPYPHLSGLWPSRLRGTLPKSRAEGGFLAPLFLAFAFFPCLDGITNKLKVFIKITQMHKHMRRKNCLTMLLIVIQYTHRSTNLHSTPRKEGAPKGVKAQQAGGGQQPRCSGSCWQQVDASRDGRQVIGLAALGL